MTIFRAIIGLSALAFFAQPSIAAGGCDGPKTGFDNVYCFAKVYMELDHQLNRNYASLMKRIPLAQQSLLRAGQRNWIGMRDSRCLKNESASNIVNIDCAIETTRQRVQFLSDRAAECAAHSCLPRKLSEFR